MNNTILGRRGEDAASVYLVELGWTILDRNWRCRQGEIDIVAHDGRQHVVCEVKTRKNTMLGTPFEAITPEKAIRLRRLAWRWAAQHGVPGAAVRVDALCLLPAEPNPGHDVFDGFDIEHLRGVI
ncbi:YraN family protein [Spirillospora sp. NPDC048911]|uniref:YraN family protein n=1 Tax=Spirillospora sp. NPDC048911 TaxID=3364527 RepID=UPI00371398E4